MKSNYKRLGDFIEPCDEKNSQGEQLELRGISNQKYFQKAKTNTNGVDLTTYRVVRTGQFAFNRATTRNGDKISIALSQEVDCIVSPSYRIFRSKNENILNSEYLMMWFKRPEFDRYARFKSHGSAHEFFDYAEMCETELPVPNIEKQREIVREYNTIVNRISLNERFIQKLEETAQAIYKQWFVEFEFPDENGKPYKTSGGKMVWREELEKEIPEGWEVKSIESILDILDGDRGSNYPSQGDFFEDEYCLFLNAGNVSKLGFDFSNTSFITEEKDKELRKGKLLRDDIILTTRGTVGNLAFYSNIVEFQNVRINSGMVILRTKKDSGSPIYSYSMMRNVEMKRTIENYLSGSAQPQLPIKDIKRIPVLIPPQSQMLKFGSFAGDLQEQVDLKNIETRKLYRFSDLLLAKITKVEENTENEMIQ